MSKTIASKTEASTAQTLSAGLVARIDKLLEQTKYTNWPENAPSAYDQNDIKWPDPVKNRNEKDESAEAPANDQAKDSSSETTAHEKGDSKTLKIVLLIAAVMILICLLFGRKAQNSYLSQGSMSLASADLLKGSMQASRHPGF